MFLSCAYMRTSLLLRLQRAMRGARRCAASAARLAARRPLGSAACLPAASRALAHRLPPPLPPPLPPFPLPLLLRLPAADAWRAVGPLQPMNQHNLTPMPPLQPIDDLPLAVLWTR